ncbi:hypothetical protein ACRAWD_32020 [Caulobacter segnis]
MTKTEPSGSGIGSIAALPSGVPAPGGGVMRIVDGWETRSEYQAP